MRWGILLLYGLLACMGLLMGCNAEEQPPVRPATSVLTFHYDAARDVVLASTHTLVQNDPITPQTYASALASYPEVSYAPAPNLRLANPEATVADGVLTVNYREAAGLEQLAAAQTAAVLAALEAWFWVPQVREVRVQAQGQPLTLLGPVALKQPLQRTYHTYVVQPQTGEVGYLIGSLTPADLPEALTRLRNREIRQFPASQGFRPLLPAGVTLTADPGKIDNGVLTVDLSTEFARADHARLAGMVLMLAQFPTVDAVQFAFGGKTVDEPFMRGNLNAPITPYLLLLPANAATVASAPVQQTIRGLAETTLGQTPASVSPALLWREWATVEVVPEAGAPPQQFILRQDSQGYTVQLYGVNMPISQVLSRGVPTEAAIALRLPGWEGLALQQ